MTTVSCPSVAFPCHTAGRLAQGSSLSAATELPVSPTRDKGLLRSRWDPDPSGSGWQKLFALRLWGWLDRRWLFLQEVDIFGEAKTWERNLLGGVGGLDRKLEILESGGGKEVEGIFSVMSRRPGCAGELMRSGLCENANSMTAVPPSRCSPDLSLSWGLGDDSF